MAGEWNIKVGLQLDKSQAQAMEKDLNGRFGRVATKFSSRLGTGLKRLAYSGILASAVGALLQPLDKLNDKIDSTLDKFSDVRDQARGFGVDEAQYLKARILSEAVGVQNFDTMFSKFRQEMIKANKGMPSALAQFRGKEGNVEDFMQLISSLKMAKPTQRQTMIGQIFGQDQIKEVNKLVTADLTRLAEKLNAGVKNEDIRSALQSVSGLREDQALLQGKRAIDELVQAPSLINKGVLQEQDAYFRKQNELLAEQMRQYSNVAGLQKGVDKIVETTNKIASGIGGFVNNFKEFIALEKQLDAQRRSGQLTQAEYDKRLDQFFKEEGVFK